jgi:hypothetical protein
MANESYSVYASAIDGYVTLPLRRDGVHEIRASDYNRLRDAIVKIEQELGVEPSGTFATVSSRLDGIGDAHAEIEAHKVTASAHTSVNIDVADSEDLFYETTVEGVLSELGTVMTINRPDYIGNDISWVPNTGIPDFYDGYGTKFVYNISDWSEELVDSEIKRTQPRSEPTDNEHSNGVRGIHILELSSSTRNGVARLEYDQTDGTIRWRAPGDSFGAKVYIGDENDDVLSEGQSIVLSSSNTSMKIRVARTSAALPSGPDDIYSDDFEVYSLDAVSGTYSIPDYGFVNSSYITRTSTSSTGVSRGQFMISGMVYPAHLGTLVLQRKLRDNSVTSFFPVAILDLADAFNSDLVETGQPAYIPSLTYFDSITLFDRLPAKVRYQEYLNADGEPVWENFNNNYYNTQLARYTIPVSNGNTAGVVTINGESVDVGTLMSPPRYNEDDITLTVGTYRLVHFKPGVTQFTGEPSADDIYSMQDLFGTQNDGDSTVRFSNVFLDSNSERPGVEIINVTPPKPDTSDEDYMYLSGIKYYSYNASDSVNRFGFRIRSNDNLASKTFVRYDTLKLTTNIFDIPSGTVDGYGYGESIDLASLFSWDPVDGYVAYDGTNLPEYDSKAWYVVNSSMLSDRKLKLPADVFSCRAQLKATFRDPFGYGDGYDGYGDDDTIIFDSVDVPSHMRNRILVNTYVNKSTDTQEYFVDEDYRVGYNKPEGTYEGFLFNTESEHFTYADGFTSDGYILSEWNKEIPIGERELQCGAVWGDYEDTCGLIWPQNDYSAGDIMPFQFDEFVEYGPVVYSEPGVFAVSYDGYGTGDYKVYQRMFNLGYPISNARLRVVSGGGSPVDFNDISYYNSSRFGKIEVKIPGDERPLSTNWLDITRLFESGGYEDGYGSLSGSPVGSAGDFTVPFTFGIKNNEYAGNMVAVRVTYFAINDHDNDVLDDTKSRTITMIELLPPVFSE